MRKLRGAVATIEINLFPFKWPPRPGSFKRWLGRRRIWHIIASGHEMGATSCSS